MKTLKKREAEQLSFLVIAALVVFVGAVMAHVNG